MKIRKLGLWDLGIAWSAHAFAALGPVQARVN